MVQLKTSKSARIRARLGHPVIDADGHRLEFLPLVRENLQDYVRKIGGGDLLKRFNAQSGFLFTENVGEQWRKMPPQARRETWTTQPAWWATPGANTLDRATASLPKLLHERMPEMGLDYTVLYPSWCLTFMTFEDDELRQVACRAVNTYSAEFYRPYADRMTPAAIIPMHTPKEAISEAEYVIKQLGLKVISCTHVMRPVPLVQKERPDLAPLAMRLDTFGIDSDYDYDPLWAKCVELGAAVSSHGGAQNWGWGSRRSISNYMYNHIGSFAASGDAICKSLFMGGVTHRFPSLRFAFLEGGVGWACMLYADTIGHWEKRNGRKVRDLDPSLVDAGQYMSLVRKYGDGAAQAKLEEIRAFLHVEAPTPEVLDDWSKCHIEKEEDFLRLFVEPFYFGCEADDPMNAWAFNTKVNPQGARLKAFFSTDIGHWDVDDMSGVVEEAYEQVEKGRLTEQDFKDFVFTNPVTFFTSQNPDFFKGTAVEAEASRLLQKARPR
ncbi:MAG: amidohydrolase [Dehalococcoidia bacterium]|nr:amidohydrolase [Dehalococcoidia bacterium]